MGGVNVGDGIRVDRADWEFNAEVAKTFDSHVGKSVPYYNETQQLAVAMSDWFVRDGSLVYDIGCATGATIADLLQRHPKKRLRCVGLDNSAAMLVQAHQRLDALNVQLIQEDVLQCSLESNISLIYCLYTLQFLDPQRRLEVCDRLYRNLVRRGAFILVEKVLDADPVVGDIYTHLHWAKKAEMGFDVSEIYGKAQSLRGVLVPFTTQENIRMLESIGFSRVSVFFKWCNFCGILAVK